MVAAEREFHGFTPGTLRFFRGISRNNNREWFVAHKAEYESHVRAPMLALIEEVDVRLATLIPEVIGSPRKSMFRIYRDVRFSADKSPYKTHAACWFFHRDAGHSVGAEAAHGGAGFYFQLDAKSSFCGGGIWMPPRPALVLIRQALATGHEEFSAIVRARSFKRTFGALESEAMLKRLPKGYEPGHPASEWLRYQSFTAGCELSRDDIMSPRLPDILARRYANMVPFVRWLNTALGLRAVTAR